MKNKVKFEDIKVFENGLIPIARVISFDMFLRAKGYVKVKRNVWANRNGLEVITREINVE